MIIWINGCFGVGKTAVANKVKDILGNAYVYNPEEVGFLMQKNVPAELDFFCFSQEKIWSDFNLYMIDKIYKEYDGHIIVPMTIKSDFTYNNTIQKFYDGDYEFEHIVLDADTEIIKKRLANRGENGDSFAVRNIKNCKDFFYKNEFKIYNTNNLDSNEVAHMVVSCVK